MNNSFAESPHRERIPTWRFAPDETAARRFVHDAAIEDLKRYLSAPDNP